ncbi:MAG: LLM class F420-dependent oxidoreductase [Acidimicrobiales bacterium]
MDIGITTAFSHHTPVEQIIGTAQRIEAAGFSTVWVPEHVLFFPEYASDYPYAEDGRVPGDPDGVLDPFSALTFIAAHTTTLRLATGICLVPQRQPVYTARLVADLDYLSGGRVDLGVGVGWLAEEFDALGVDFSARGRLCDEYIGVMRAMWGPDPVTHRGDTVRIDNAQANPKPVQAPVPVYIGGESGPALRRVARLGDGWYGFNLTPEGLAEKLERLDPLLADAGRTRAELSIAVSPGRNRVEPEHVAAYAAAGADQVVVGLFGRNLDEIDRRLDRLRPLLDA